MIPVPDSGVPATIGYAEAAEHPVRARPGAQPLRGPHLHRAAAEHPSLRVRLKLNPISGVLRGKRVVVVDDSIVRGTTSRKIVKMLRDAGAPEVHMRISSPPTKWPCYYGIDTPTRGELIASSHRVEEINQYITSDPLAYLSLDEMGDAVLRAREEPLERKAGVASDRARAGQDELLRRLLERQLPGGVHPPPRQRQMRLEDVSDGSVSEGVPGVGPGGMRSERSP